MTSFTPLVTVEELGIYLSDTTINADRAAMLIEDAQQQCADFLAPLDLPAGATRVIRQVAGDAYMATTARQAQMAAAGAAFGAQPVARRGGVWLSLANKADLRRMAKSSNAFSINMLSADYDPGPFPIWDVNNATPDVATS